MSERATRRAQRSEEMRQRIVETAAEMFRENNYDAVSVRDIAARLGVTTGTLYHHFKSKDEILLHICGSHESGLAEAMQRYTLQEPLADLVDFLTGPMVDRVLEDGVEFTRHRLFSIMAGKTPEAVPKDLTKRPTGLYRRLDVFLRSAQQKGQLGAWMTLEEMVDYVAFLYRGCVYYACTVSTMEQLRPMLRRRLEIGLRAICASPEQLCARLERKAQPGAAAT